MEAQSGMPLGVIACQNLAVYQATQLLGSALNTKPTDNVTRQEMSMDAQRSVVETNTPVNYNRLARKIRTHINGSWLEVMVCASSLRQALFLSLHDLFENFICGNAHRKTLGLILKMLIMEHPQYHNQNKNG